MIDFFNETAKRCHDKPDGWRWWKLDSHDKPPGFFEVTGGVPIGVHKSGKRKGRPKWSKGDGERIWMRDSDLEETKRLWSVETGKCSKCQGSGKQVHSVSVADGTTYRECKECLGTGEYRSETK